MLFNYKKDVVKVPRVNVGYKYYEGEVMSRSSCKM